jgi:DNA-binding MarR family transcriptional regulator
MLQRIQYGGQPRAECEEFRSQTVHSGVADGGLEQRVLPQHVDYLQELGFTESNRLQDDRRVRLVRRTAKGDEAVDFSRRAIAGVERTWEKQLGAERYAALREALLDLGA